MVTGNQLVSIPWIHYWNILFSSPSLQVLTVSKVQAKPLTCPDQAAPKDLALLRSFIFLFNPPWHQAQTSQMSPHFPWICISSFRLA